MKKDFDLVLCLDVTGDMLDVIKDICEKEFNYLSTTADKIRFLYDGGDLFVTVVQFRDIEFDKEEALTVSRRFSLPKEKTEFKQYLDSIKTDGGGDKPESALEALTKAKKLLNKDAYRRAVALFTNAPYKEDFQYANNAEREEILRGIAEIAGGFSAKRYADAIAVAAPKCYEWESFERFMSDKNLYYYSCLFDGEDCELSEKADEINEFFNKFFNIYDE